MKKLFKNQYFWLVIILALAFWVRLYKIDNPIADWHSWRQADTAAVARSFYKEGFNPFLPKYDDMVGIAEDPIANPQRYRFVEFPIYNSLVYFGYLINGGVDEKIARLVAVLFSLGSLLFVYVITRKYFGIFNGLVAAFLFGVLPFNIYFSRVILPEPSLVFFCLGMFWFVQQWIVRPTQRNILLAMFFTAAAFLTKPYAIFYLLPLVVVYQSEVGRWWPIPRRFWIFLIAFLPIIAWRIWIGQHPEGIPASNWLFNGDGIRFKLVFWQWILHERIGKEILTVSGTILFFVGLLLRPRNGEGWLMHALALSGLLFLVTLATGNVRHDYYQAFIVPILVIFVSRGFVLLLQGVPSFVARMWTIPLALLLLIMTLYSGWNEVKGLYQINNPVILEAGQAADKLLPQDAVVVAPYGGDTSFLYQTNRVGWAVVALPLAEMVSKYNVSYYISTARDAKTNWVIRNYSVIADQPNYLISDLKRPLPHPAGYIDPEPAQ